LLCFFPRDTAIAMPFSPRATRTKAGAGPV